MTTVTIYELNQGRTITAGSISWDGAQYHLSPPTDPALASILWEPVLDVQAHQSVTAQSDPERFLSLLHLNYTGSHLWASVPYRT